MIMNQLTIIILKERPENCLEKPGALAIFFLFLKGNGRQGTSLLSTISKVQVPFPCQILFITVTKAIEK